MEDERIDLLRVHKSTHGLDDEQLRLIAEHVEIVRCQEGDTIHQPNETVDALLLVAAGRLTVTAVTASGTEAVIDQIGRDHQFGLLMLSAEEPFPLRVTAANNAKLLRIPKQAAAELMHELPSWQRNLLRSLGPRLVDSLLNKRQRQSRRLVALIHLAEESRDLTSAILQRLSQLGEKVALLTDRQSPSADLLWKTEQLLDSAGRIKSVAELRGVIAGWHDADRVIFEGSVDSFAESLQELTDGCEAVFWACPSGSTAAVAVAAGALVQASPARKEKQFAIRMLAEGEQAAPFAPELDSIFKQDFKLHWNDASESPVCSRQAGIDRIVHYLRGVSIGLALGGGAARGMAHLGVLQVLEKAGIVIDRLSGTSVGALTGVVYAAGYPPDFQIEGFGGDLTPPWYYRLLPFGDAWYLLRKYRSGGWDGMLRPYLHSWRLEQLAIPFSAVAVDLVEAQQVIRDTGDATQAILESINLPGIARPICRDGQTLVDGGILNVVPADVLFNQDTNFVISSDVAAHITTEFAGNRPDTPTDKMKVPSSFQTASRVRMVQDRNIRSMGGSQADIVIEPDVSLVQLTDFKQTAKTAELGRVAAEAVLPEIQRLLHQLDAQLFPLAE